MTKKAVTYARVSGDDRGNEGRNLAGQLAMCREYAAKKGYQIIAELAEDDRGASGASFELEQLSQVLEMARNQQYDVLVVREIDRLSRNLAKQLIVEEELRRAGVQIEYVLGEYPDTPEGTLMKHIRAVVAEYEREKIRERIERGKRLKVKSGSVMTNGANRSPYGYNVVECESKWILEIYEPEAQIVRLIFSWYTKGDEGGRLTIRGITRKLTEMGVPTRMDSGRQVGGYKLRKWGEWSEGQVANILESEVYRGLWHYGKRGANGRGKGKDPIAVKVPALVDDDTWQLAQGRREENRLLASRNKKYFYLLSGRLRCGHCHYSVNGEPNQGNKLRLYYRCKATHSGHIANVRCNAPGFSAPGVDNLVWDWVRGLLMSPELLQEGLEARLAENEERIAPLQERLNVIDKLMEDNQAQLDRLIELYIAGDFSKELLLDRKKRLETTMQSLGQERDRLMETIQERTLTPDQIQSIHAFAAEIRGGLQFAETRNEAKREVIEALDVRVTLSKENGEKIVYAECILGNDKLWAVSTSKCNDTVHTPAR